MIPYVLKFRITCSIENIWRLLTTQRVTNIVLEVTLHALQWVNDTLQYQPMYFLNDFWMDSLSHCHFSPCWMALVCLCSGKADEEVICHSNLLSIFKSIPEFTEISLFNFPHCLVEHSPLSIDLVFRIWHIPLFQCVLCIQFFVYHGGKLGCYCAPCSCNTLYHTGVKNSLFTDSERCFIKMNNSCSYLVPPEQPSMGFLSTEQTEPKSYWVSIIHLITSIPHVNCSSLSILFYALSLTQTLRTFVVSADWWLFSFSCSPLTLHVDVLVPKLLLVLVPYVVPVVLLWSSRRVSSWSWATKPS